MQDNSFDKNIRHKLEGYQVEPSPKVWAGLENELDRKKRRYFFLWWLIPVLLIIGILIQFSGDQSNNKKEFNLAQNEKPQTVPSGFKAEERTSYVDMEKTKIESKPSVSDKLSHNSSVFPADSSSQKTVQPYTIKSISPGTASNNSDDKTTVNDHKKIKKIAAKTKIKIHTATAESDDIENSALIQSIKNDSTHENSTEPFLEKDSLHISLNPKQVTTIEKHLDNIPQDSMPAKKSETEKRTTAGKWDKQWIFGSGYASISKLKLGSSAYDALYNSGINIGSGSQLLTTNQYFFNKGIFLNAGIYFNRSMGTGIKFVTGLQYTFQHISVKRKYRIDSSISGSPSNYTNITTKLYKESLDIHSIDIPVLVNITISKKISLGAGIINRFGFSTQWKNYKNILGDKKTYLPMFHLNPAYQFNRISIGPLVSIGLKQYANENRILNFGASLKYSPQK